MKNCTEQLNGTYSRLAMAGLVPQTLVEHHTVLMPSVCASRLPQLSGGGPSSGEGIQLKVTTKPNALTTPHMIKTHGTPMVTTAWGKEPVPNDAPTLPTAALKPTHVARTDEGNASDGIKYVAMADTAKNRLTSAKRNTLNQFMSIYGMRRPHRIKNTAAPEKPNNRSARRDTWCSNMVVKTVPNNETAPMRSEK